MFRLEIPPEDLVMAALGYKRHIKNAIKIDQVRINSKY